MKIPRHIRLAYLCKLIQLQLLAGKNVNSNWKRQNKIVKAMDRYEREFNTFGFIIGKKIIRINYE